MYTLYTCIISRHPMLHVSALSVSLEKHVMKLLYVIDRLSSRNNSQTEITGCVFEATQTINANQTRTQIADI